MSDEKYNFFFMRVMTNEDNVMLMLFLYLDVTVFIPIFMAVYGVYEGCCYLVLPLS